MIIPKTSATRSRFLWLFVPGMALVILIILYQVSYILNAAKDINTLRHRVYILKDQVTSLESLEQSYLKFKEEREWFPQDSAVAESDLPVIVLDMLFRENRIDLSRIEYLSSERMDKKTAGIYRVSCTTGFDRLLNLLEATERKKLGIRIRYLSCEAIESGLDMVNCVMEVAFFR